MNIWTTADSHFGHANIIKHAGRPFADVEDMDAQLIERWNARVAPRDEVWFLGDLSFHKQEQTSRIFHQLHGFKHLIVGNHDPSRVCEMNWKSVQQMRTIKVAGVRAVMCHYPFEVWDGAHHGAVHLHGHSHGTGTVRPRRMDVGIDCNPHLAPFNMEDVVLHLAGEQHAAADHHGR